MQSLHQTDMIYLCKQTTALHNTLLVLICCGIYCYYYYMTASLNFHLSSLTGKKKKKRKEKGLLFKFAVNWKDWRVAHECESDGGQSVHSLFRESFRQKVKKNKYFTQSHKEMCSATSTPNSLDSFNWTLKALFREGRRPVNWHVFNKTWGAALFQWEDNILVLVMQTQPWLCPQRAVVGATRLWVLLPGMGLPAQLLPPTLAHRHV